jgi:MFS superfamily sulfate permease-like transporter
VAGPNQKEAAASNRCEPAQATTNLLKHASKSTSLIHHALLPCPALPCFSHQVRYIFGYKVPRVDTLHESIKVLLDNINKFQWKEFVMGMSMIWLLVALKMLAKRYKKAFWISALGPISACVIGIVAVVAGNLQNKGIKIVENIPKGGFSEGFLCRLLQAAALALTASFLVPPPPC